jgi:uncharacterized protein YcnI
MINFREQYERIGGKQLTEKRFNVSSISDGSKLLIKSILKEPDDVYDMRVVKMTINSLSDDGVSSSAMMKIYKKSKWQFLDALEDLLKY